MALLKSLASGLGLCRVPDTSGVDDTFFLLIFDAPGKSWLDKIDAGCAARAPATPTCARAAATPPTPRADPAPSRSIVPP